MQNKIIFVDKDKLQTIKTAALDKTKFKDRQYATISKPYNEHYKKENLSPEIPKKTIYEVLRDNNCDNDQGGLIFEGNYFSYKKLLEEIDNTAKGLKAQGVKKGDTIAAALTSTPEAVYLLYAASRLGVTFASIDPRDSVKEIKQKLSDASPKLFFVADGFEKEKEITEGLSIEKTVTVSPIRSLPTEIKEYLKISNPEMFMVNEDKKHIAFDTLIKKGEKESLGKPEKYNPNHIAAMVYTGASTSNGKGVMLNDYSFNALGVCQKNSDFPWEKGKVFLNVLPQFIAYGVCNALHVPLMYGETVILANPLRIDKFPEYILETKPDHVFASPIHIRFMKNSPLINDETDLSFIEMFACGGAGMPLEEDIENRKFFESHGAKDAYGQGYGLTEVNAAFCYGRGTKNKEGFVGIPFAGNDAAIFDPDTLEELPYGKNLKGVLMLKTPTTMMGYFGESAYRNKEIFVKDEADNIWVSTEDTSIMDEDGRIQIIDRQKRGFNCLGMNVYPSTIENVLAKHKGIYESIVVGIKHPLLDMAPIANIVLKPEYKGKEEQIMKELEEIIKEELPDYTLIYAYNFRDNLPYTTRGKPNYTEIASQGIEELGNNKVFVKKINSPKEILEIKG
ncbi:MAG: acyl--CoA ligase [Bacilli bacterium]|nr:acyl--CoA ligase [Bacilli bacterium]